MKENRKTKCSLIQLVWLNLLSSTRHKYRSVIVQANATSVTRRLNVLILTHALTKTYNAQRWTKYYINISSLKLHIYDHKALVNSTNKRHVP